jgi:glycosyltransferase 2 family protein
MGLLIRLSISIALIALLFSRIDTDDLKSAADFLELKMLILSGAGLAVLGLVQAIRWRIIVQAASENFSYPAALRGVLVGIFFNQTLPSSIGGDAMRIWEGRKHGLSLGCAINSVVIDRIVALVALFVIVVLAVGNIIELLPEHNAGFGVAVICIVVVGCLWFLVSADRWAGYLPDWRLIQSVQRLSRDARAVFMSFRILTIAILLAVAIHIGVIAIVVQLAWSMGISLGFLDALGLLPFVFLVSAIPISVSGWGTREAAMVTALSLVGIEAGQALALSVGVGLSMVFSGIPGGFLWLAKRYANSASNDLPASLKPHE